MKLTQLPGVWDQLASPIGRMQMVLICFLASSTDSRCSPFLSVLSQFHVSNFKIFSHRVRVNCINIQILLHMYIYIETRAVWCSGTLRQFTVEYPAVAVCQLSYSRLQFNFFTHSIFNTFSMKHTKKILFSTQTFILLLKVSC